MVFSVFSELCNHHHYINLVHFYHPISNHSPFSSPNHWQPLIKFLYTFWMSHINGIMQLVVVMTGFFHVV